MKYQLFYRSAGIRILEQLAHPRLKPIGDLKLPVSSMVHYVSETAVDFGLASDDPMITGVDKLILTDHLSVLAANKGNPKATQLSANKLSRDYHRKNRRFRPLRRLETVDKDRKTLIVANYALLEHLYRYTTSFYSSYYRWFNIESTVWHNVNRMAEVSERQHFIKCSLPDLLPSLGQLKTASTGDVTKKTLGIFNSPEALRILEIYKWLGGERENSVLNHLTPESLERVNLLWLDHGRWCVMNLGVINTWITSDEGELTSEVAQRYFVRMLISLYESRTLADSDVVTSSDSDDDESLDDPTIAIKKKPDAEVLSEADLEEDLQRLEQIADRQQEQAGSVQVAVDIDEILGDEPTVENGVLNKIDEMADNGQLSAAEYRRLTAIANKYKNIPNPAGDGTLVDLATVTDKDLAITDYSKIPDMAGVPDKSMLQSVLLDFDQRYINSVLKKDIAAAVVTLQKAGHAVTDYKIQHVQDAMNNFEVHTVKIVPAQGAPSTIRFRVPVISENGTFMSDGVVYSMRKQRGDLPIRKTSPSTVALTSYVAKVFVNRSEKKVNNVGQWFIDKISLMLKQQDERIVEAKVSNVFNHKLELPYMYSELSKKFRSLKIKGGYNFFFEWKHRDTVIDTEALKKYEDKNTVACGTFGKKVLLMDDSGTIYAANPNGQHEVLGRMEDLLELDPTKVPVEVAEVKIFSKVVPLGLVLGFHLGFSNLLSLLKVKYRTVPAGTRITLASDELAIRFADEAIIYNRTDRIASMVLSGFINYKRSIIRYNRSTFEKKEVYYNVFEANGVTVPFIRQMIQLREQFIDHITHGILEDMEEPTRYVPLLMRAVELLVTNWHPEEVDHAYQRIKGYERVAGAVYGEIGKSLRQHASRPASAKAQVTMNPEAVWQQILQDPSLTLVDDANPLYNVRDKEVVTFSGTGGRSGRSMVKRTRVFTESDVGVISESTVDSSAVGVVTYLTADPNFTSLRGTSRRFDYENDGASKVMGTCALLAPAADRDDPKRVNFIGIQQQSGIFADGYVPSPVSTGYDRVLAHRVDAQFAHAAKQDGKVVALTDTSMSVELEDGTKKHFELGRVFGKAKDVTIPHEIVANVKLGDSFNTGDVLLYNSNFFQKDIFNEKQVVWKAGILVRTAVMESTDTLEDSSAISEKIAGQMTTRQTKVTDVVLGFDQAVSNMVKVGNTIDVETILCTIEDSVTSDNNLFDDDSRDTLKLLESQAPKSKYQGKVERIEVFYNGDKEDMHESLRAIVNVSDRNFKRRSSNLGKPSITGKVGKGFRVSGNNLLEDNLVIKFYITGDMPAGVGDKGVFGNQLKTIFGRIMSGTNETESGLPIDAIFGYQSISDRIVTSPILMGLATTLLKKIGQDAVKIYRGK